VWRRSQSRAIRSDPASGTYHELSDAQARALKQDPSNLDVRTELENLAGQAGLWTELEKVLRDVADELTDALLARAYWMRLAAIDDDHLGKSGGGRRRIMTGGC